MFKDISNPIQARIKKLRINTDKLKLLEDFLRGYLKRIFPRVVDSLVYTIEIKNTGDILFKFKNKIISQELSLRKNEIEESLYQKGITNKIVIN